MIPILPTILLRENGLKKANLSESERLNIVFREEVNENDKSFYTNENCTNCGICEQV